MAEFKTDKGLVVGLVGKVEKPKPEPAKPAAKEPTAKAKPAAKGAKA